MKAAVSVRYGPPHVVRIKDLPTPTPTGSQILVKVHATTVNRTDCAYRAGKPLLARAVYGIPRPKATVLGSEFAGSVEAIGANVTLFKPGDRVFGYNEGKFGGHAEFMVIDETASVATVPAGMSYEQIVPSTEGAHYALSAIRAAKVVAGQRVLVNGATGAIGSAAVQLLKALDVWVTAVCGTAHLELVKGLGADRVIDYTADDFTHEQDSYDVVLDAVGKSSFGACKRLLRPHGIYLSTELGPRAENPFFALVTPLFGGRRVKFPIPKHSKQIVEHFRTRMESGAFTPLVDRRYQLAQIVDAYHYVETGEKVGNVLISVDAEG
jgi:NADPH:quinone reductase-like Zn-dependent oxidoreductase